MGLGFFFFFFFSWEREREGKRLKGEKGNESNLIWEEMEMKRKEKGRKENNKVEKEGHFFDSQA